MMTFFIPWMKKFCNDLKIDIFFRFLSLSIIPPTFDFTSYFFYADDSRHPRWILGAPRL